MGATTNDVLRLVASSAARVVSVGAVIGLAIAVAAARLLTTVLFGVEPLDPITFVWVGMMLAGTAVVAIAGPAWRAAQHRSGGGAAQQMKRPALAPAEVTGVRRARTRRAALAAAAAVSGANSHDSRPAAPTARVLIA